MQCTELLKCEMLYTFTYSNMDNLFFIVVPCTLITMKFLSLTNAPLYYTYKILKCTVKLSHDCSYMFWSTWTIIREPMPNLAKSPQNCNFSKVRHRLPDDGPGGPKHVGAIMRYFNCTF